MSTPGTSTAACQRRRYALRGQVQGVGFRPFVFRLAQRLGVRGLVRNASDGVIIEAQAAPDTLDRFATALRGECPPLARIDAIRTDTLPTAEDDGFSIVASDCSAPAAATITVDTAVCAHCLREMRDPADRRFGYGLVNCTHCGPRYTIVCGVPYDRPRTTMAGFALCDACAAEYADPADRRFHAQPISCPACGPQVMLVDRAGAALPGEAIAGAAELLRDGRIVAIKGLGGFHLAVRADAQAGVASLRRRKGRDAKPLALMVADLDTALRFGRFGAAARTLMTSPVCPIVLAPRCDAANTVAPGVADGYARLGVMLPATPIQHLLCDALTQRGMAGVALVMTSGNRADEPLVIDNDDALRRLGPLCDALLWHDRPIRRGVDDSVFLDLGDEPPMPLRRARGLAPAALPLPVPATQPGLCVGGDLKNTIAVVRGDEAILAQHLGDLEHPLALGNFRAALDDLVDLFEVSPRWIAHDLHPAYLSTSWARTLARRFDAPLFAVQHHHAHAAAVLAEHGHTGRALAVVCDGVGFGEDRTAWGGELLACDLRSFQRLAHLRPLWLAGGDAAARDPRRCALALLHHALGDDFAQHPLTRRLVPDPEALVPLSSMVKRRISGAFSSGAGRYFDAIAAMLGLCGHIHYEAQAAMAVESAAISWSDDASVNGRWMPRIVPPGSRGGPVTLDFGPFIRCLADAVLDHQPAPRLAMLFHEAFARTWCAAVRSASRETGLVTVCLAGGVFANAILLRRLTDLLHDAGLRVLRPLRVPPGDGGLALGQAAVAAARRASNPA